MPLINHYTTNDNEQRFPEIETYTHTFSQEKDRNGDTQKEWKPAPEVR